MSRYDHRSTLDLVAKAIEHEQHGSEIDRRLALILFDLSVEEAIMRLFDYHYEGAARRHFRSWYNWATHSRLKPIIAVARMLKRRFENVITYLKHPITNAIAEGINSQIQWVKYTARGFRSKANFVTAIYFHCGGLDLMPKST